jgi:hypothetical protein
MDTTTKFDRRLQHVPESWRGALVDVIDTAEVICLGLQQPSFGVGNSAIECPQLVADLTRLACERSNAADASTAIDPRVASDAPVPVAVSDRLPGKDDCNNEGFYWCNGKCSYDSSDERFLWVLSRIEDENEEMDFPPCTHWLPYGALPHLPIPATETPDVPTN